MAEGDRAWKDVAENVSALGERLRRRFEEDRDDPDSRAVRDAVRSLNEAAERLSERVTGVVRDPEVRESVQRIVQSLRDALGTSFDQVGEEVREAFGRRRHGGTDRDAGAGGTPPGDADDGDGGVPEPPRAVPPTTGGDVSPAPDGDGEALGGGVDGEQR